MRAAVMAVIGALFLVGCAAPDLPIVSPIECNQDNGCAGVYDVTTGDLQVSVKRGTVEFLVVLARDRLNAASTFPDRTQTAIVDDSHDLCDLTGTVVARWPSNSNAWEVTENLTCAATGTFAGETIHVQVLGSSFR